MAPPTIHTYHCICTHLLLASTHTLSLLPRRAAPLLDAAIILPLPSLESLESSPNLDPDSLAAEGYTHLLGVIETKKPVVIRREDGFERRTLWRCGRCEVVVGYEIVGADAKGKGKGNEVEGKGRFGYVLPGGVVGTEVMVKGIEGGRRLGEGDVGIGRGVVGAWE